MTVSCNCEYMHAENARLRADLAALVPLARVALDGGDVYELTDTALDAARRVLAAYEKEGT